MNQPLLSIIMPTFNRKEFLLEAIDSVIRQSYQNFELLIFDDCSTYDIAEFVDFKDRRIRLFRNSQNLGQAANVIQALKIAKGELVCIFHDDDIMSDDYISSFVRVFEEHDVDFVYSDHYLINHDGTINHTATESSSEFYGRASLKQGIHSNSLEQAIIVQSVPQISLLWKNGTLDTNKLDPKAGPAIDMWVRYLVANGSSGYYLKNKFNYYRQHAGSQTSKGINLEMLNALDYCYIRILSDVEDKRVVDSIYSKLAAVRRQKILYYLKKKNTQFLLEGFKYLTSAKMLKSSIR